MKRSDGDVASEAARFVTDYEYGEIRIFSQTATDANSAESGTLLGIATQGGNTHTPGDTTNGLEFGTPASGVVPMSGEWRGTWLADGTPASARLYDKNVTTGASTTAKRIDLTLGETSSFEVQLSNMAAETDGEFRVTSFNYRVPQESS